MSKAPLFKTLTFVCFLLAGCVERYYPEEGALKTGTLVINAHLTDQPGMQVIEISRSVDLINPVFDPVYGSLARVIREDGELREFSEFRPGYYEAELDDQFLQTGASYMIQVQTPDGNVYESVFDKLRPVPAIDSLYYQVESASFASESDSISGIRFYLDFTFDNEAYEYIRWDLTETYEFHNPDMQDFILDADFRVKELTDTNKYLVCYITNELFTIQSMSTENLDFGSSITKPFDFIPNNQLEQKLHHKYSLLVKQYSLGEEAFHYWNELKKTSQEQGWLYDRQPALLRSNIHNVNDESEVVLGFFCMEGMVEKRAFAIKPEGLDLSPYEFYCYPELHGRLDLDHLDRLPVPMYFARPWLGGDTIFGLVEKECVDCREYKNSTHNQPGFW